jgi:muramoyltetrapeptide carboxypeptidase
VAAGASVSVVAPASFAQPERVERGLEVLRIFDLAPRVGTSAQTRGPLYFAGTGEQRLADLHAAFADEGTSAVMCLRGGYGSNYLLDGLDLKLIASHPKPFFAYSDLTCPLFTAPWLQRISILTTVSIYPAFTPLLPAGLTV